MEEYSEWVDEQIKEDDGFNLFNEIEIAKYRRDAHASLHDFDGYDYQHKVVELLQYKLLFRTISEN